MKNNLLKMVCSLLLVVVAGCSTKSPQDETRYFFPPAPAEPKIEYIGSYYSDKDVTAGKSDFLSEYVLGDTNPEAIFTTPVDVASDAQRGKVYVADTGSRNVFVLDLENMEIDTLSHESRGDMSRGFGVPVAVSVDNNGHVYVSDVVTGGVDVFDYYGRYLNTIGDSTLTRPTAVAVDSQIGTVYVLDTANHRLAKYSMDGKFLENLGRRGGAPGEFNFPTDVDIDSLGNIFVLDSLNARVQVFDREGQYLRMFGEKGTAAGSFSIPKMLAVSGFGHVYVTDALAHKFVIFDHNGEFLLRIGGKSVFRDGLSPGGFYLPRGIEADANGTIWVVDSLNRMVHRFQYLTEDYLQQYPVN